MNKNQVPNCSVLSHFPKASGCYIIRDGDLVLYVGQSENLQRRWNSHNRRGFIKKHFPNAMAYFIFLDEEERVQKEIDLINELHPIINERINKAPLEQRIEFWSQFPLNCITDREVILELLRAEMSK